MGWKDWIPTIATLATLVSVWWMIHRDLKSDLNDRFEKLDGRFKEIDAKFEDIGTRFAGIVATIAEISERVARLESWLAAKFSHAPGITFAGTSPLKLTDLGETISEELNAPTWAEEIAVKLEDKVKGKPDYEIQEMYFEYVKDNSVSRNGNRSKGKCLSARPKG